MLQRGWATTESDYISIMCWNYVNFLNLFGTEFLLSTSDYFINLSQNAPHDKKKKQTKTKTCLLKWNFLEHKQFAFPSLNWFQRVCFLLLKVEIPLLFDAIYSCPRLALLCQVRFLFLLERDSLKWLGCQVCDAFSFQLSLHGKEMWGRAAPQPSQYWYCTMAVEAQAPRF